MKGNKFMDKLKEGVSVQEVEDFARKYATEVFTVLSIVIGAISSIFDFFTGPGLTILFFAIGIIAGILFPTPVEKGLKQFHSFAAKQERSTQLILGAVKIVVAIFIPFLLFGMLGLLAGGSYHYYERHSQMSGEKKPPRTPRGTSSEEHD